MKNAVMSRRWTCSFKIQWLLVATCFFFTLGCINGIEEEVYFIPEGFIGAGRIIFSQETGVAAEYEGNSRIYRMPPNGILITRFKTNAGIIKNKNIRRYYYTNNLGEITDTIPSLYLETPDEVEAMNQVGVINFGYIGTSLDNNEIQYLFFMVDTVNRIFQKYERIQDDNYGTILNALKEQ
jgi:hypothetical protein